MYDYVDNGLHSDTWNACVVQQFSVAGQNEMPWQ